MTLRVVRRIRLLLISAAVIGLVATVFVSAHVTLAAEADIAGILKAIDRQSNFQQTDVSAVMTMITQDPEKGREKTVVRQFRRDSEDKFLILIEEPEVKKGQGYLRDGDNLWFYDPESRKFSHTSLKETFQESDARQSDFSQSSLAEDYRIVSYKSAALGKYGVYVIDLEALNDEVTYPYLKVWVTKETHLMLKVESYSLTKRLMRTALYPRYAKVGDSIIPKQMVFIDELVDGKKTQIALTEISLEPLPDNVFTKSFVERVNR